MFGIEIYLITFTLNGNAFNSVNYRERIIHCAAMRYNDKIGVGKVFPLEDTCYHQKEFNRTFSDHRGLSTIFYT